MKYNKLKIYVFTGKKMLEIASLTKIMTCYVSLKLIEKFKIEAANVYVKVSKQAC